MLKKETYFYPRGVFNWEGPAPPGLRLWVSSPKVVWTGLTEQFSNFQSRDIGIIGPENRHKSLAWKRSHDKYAAKNISHDYLFQDTLLPPPTHYWHQWVFYFLFLPKYLRLFSKRLNAKKKTASNVLLRRRNKQRIQNQQFANNANKIR